MAKRHTLTYSASEFSSDENPALKNLRIDYLSLNLILVWIGRHIIHDSHIKSKHFGGFEDGSNFVFWFKTKADCDNANNFLNEIIDGGVPKNRYL